MKFRRPVSTALDITSERVARMVDTIFFPASLVCLAGPTYQLTLPAPVLSYVEQLRAFVRTRLRCFTDNGHAINWVSLLHCFIDA